MRQTATKPAAGLTDDAPFVVLNATARGPLLLVCEHASNSVPSRLSGQLATADVIQSHAGWDPGALNLAVSLSEIFNAPLVAATISRLVYDLNRPPESPDAMRASSEIYDVPGNTELTSAERAKRVADIYTPFHDAVAETLRERVERHTPTVLVTVHTFAPVYMGETRNVQIGILHDADSRFADEMLNVAPGISNLRVERNKPYAPVDGVTHTLRRHALPNNI